MALLDEEQQKLLVGLAVGLGVSWAAREFLAPFRQAARPLAKAGIKSSILIAERGRETAARLGETVEDLVAEVVAERAIEHISAEGADWDLEAEGA